MAKRLHILLPAIGIGIFLCALDQLLAVATVSILHLTLREISFLVSNPLTACCVLVIILGWSHIDGCVEFHF